jgi:glycosyltransferase involved in cell wall biosynthesis
MSKTNLLYIITKLELGGAQKQLLNLIRHLDKERFNVSLFTAQEGRLVADASSIAGLTLNRSRYLERRINPFKDFLALIEIFLFIKKNKIDIVHTHSSKAGILGRLAARLAKARTVVHTVHGWSFNNWQSSLKRNLFIWLERIAAGFTDKIIVVSRRDMDIGLKNRIATASKYTIIRYGLDYNEFVITEDGIKEELRISPDSLVVTMVSCLKPQKNPRDFIRIASLVTKELSNVKFLLVGDGILRASVEDLIDRFKLRQKVNLLGWRTDIPRILSITDVLILTSLWEGLPIVVLEAMASSKPVIATDTGGVTEVIREADTGFLARPGDVNTMSEKLAVLLRDRSLRQTIGRKAKDSLGPDFSAGNTFDNTQELYVSLVAESNQENMYAN